MLVRPKIHTTFMLNSKQPTATSTSEPAHRFAPTMSLSNRLATAPTRPQEEEFNNKRFTFGTKPAVGQPLYSMYHPSTTKTISSKPTQFMYVDRFSVCSLTRKNFGGDSDDDDDLQTMNGSTMMRPFGMSSLNRPSDSRVSMMSGNNMLYSSGVQRPMMNTKFSQPIKQLSAVPRRNPLSAIDDDDDDEEDNKNKTFNRPTFGASTSSTFQSTGIRSNMQFQAPSTINRINRFAPKYNMNRSMNEDDDDDDLFNSNSGISSLSARFNK